VKAVLAQAQAIANGMNLTKELGNLSPNVCTPTYLANTAKNWPTTASTSKSWSASSSKR
jgi:leucyl aminopeptidase